MKTERVVVAVTLMALLVLPGCRDKNAPKSLDGNQRKGITTQMTGWKYTSHGGGKDCHWWIETKVKDSKGKEIRVVVNQGASGKKNKKTSVQFYSTNAGAVFVAKFCAPFYRSDQDVEE